MQVQFSKHKANLPTCYHCGEVCQTDEFQTDNKSFCCQGCQTVYEMLKQGDLCDYYTLNESAGVNRKKILESEKYNYLDLSEIQQKLLSFSDGKTAKVTFFIPTIHCTSCIWLLEHLYKLNPAITFSRINFMKKELAVTFLEKEVSLKEVVVLLVSLGYEPSISLQDTENEEEKRQVAIDKANQHSLISKMAVAGFCFGNVMLLSFPEYFGFDSASKISFKYLFNLLNLAFALPIILYSGKEFLTSAYNSAKKGILNIDFPLALGMLVLFVRSYYEVIFLGGEGYVDTLTGFVFFLLVGKWFQQKTFDNLRYDRSFKSYFPVAVLVKKEDGTEQATHLAKLQKGDRIIVRNHEIIPADALLLMGNASIDYSFVTGEAIPVKKIVGEMIYAGGRQVGNRVELEVVKPVSQSYLTQLWNSNTYDKHSKDLTTAQTAFNQYFSVGLVALATAVLAYWLWRGETHIAFNAFTSVLIIACPCALALSSQFALGTALRVLSNYHFYLKNSSIIEKIAQIKSIVFDKTGTITENNTTDVEFFHYRRHIAEKILAEIPPSSANDRSYRQEVVYVNRKVNTTIGASLSPDEWHGILSLTKNSTHPLSVAITAYIRDLIDNNSTLITHRLLYLDGFREYAGKGIEGKVNDVYFKIGSQKFVTGQEEECCLQPNCEIVHSDKSTKVFVSINGIYKGYFRFSNRYRQGVNELVTTLQQNYDLHLLSGDNNHEEQNLLRFFKHKSQLHFQQSPTEKLDFIQFLQSKGKKIMMLGDGLNDAGALLQSEVGVAVTENIAYFTPASDAILEAQQLPLLHKLIAFCQQSVQIIHWSFILALVYNTVGLFFAVQGTLSPLLSAILMPLSSINVMLFTTGLVKWYEKKIF
jgi:Cu+-exporting ATPase